MGHGYTAIGVDARTNSLHLYHQDRDEILMLHHDAPSGRVRRYLLTEAEDRTLTDYIDIVDDKLGWRTRETRYIELDSNAVLASSAGIKGGSRA